MTWDEEIEQIVPMATRYGVDPAFVAAIRRAEWGTDAKAFGVLSVAAPDYMSQLRVCCNSVKNALLRYVGNPLAAVISDGKSVRIKYSDDFIQTFAQRWAPRGATNDPTDLNANWFTNTLHWYRRFLDDSGLRVA
jgi:hypothetical protein